ERAVAASTPTDADADPAIPEELLTPPPRPSRDGPGGPSETGARLGVAFLRALHNLSRSDPRAIDERMLALDPDHLAARRNRILANLGQPGASRRDLVAITDAAPMFGK